MQAEHTGSVGRQEVYLKSGLFLSNSSGILCSDSMTLKFDDQSYHSRQRRVSGTKDKPVRTTDT